MSARGKATKKRAVGYGPTFAGRTAEQGGCLGLLEEDCLDPCVWRPTTSTCANPRLGKVMKDPRRVAAARRAAAKNPWLRHVQQVRAQNPGISYREALQLASATYQKGGYGCGYNGGNKKMDIVDTAASAGNFDTLLTAAEAAGLVGALKGPGPLTVFAPTDEAFAKVPEDFLNALLANPEQLAEVLKYHVVPGKLMSNDVVASRFLETLQGQPIDVSELSLVDTDIKTKNGVIHVIDEVLVPDL